MSRMLNALALASILVARLPAPPLATRPGPTARGGQGASERARARVVAATRRQVGKPFRGDCSGFVRQVYAEAGVPLPSKASARSGTESIVRLLPRTQRPRPGDLAYFHRTHDRDRTGKARNLFTHIAVVESVDGARVSLIHRSNTGVERLKMDLARRGDPKVNGALRRRKASDPPTQRYLASQLLAGFASPFHQARAGQAPAAPASSKSPRAISQLPRTRSRAAPRRTPRA